MAERPKSDEEKPEIEWEELRASTDFREIFRYKRGKEIEVYNLRPVRAKKAELWVATYRDGSHVNDRREGTFSTSGEAVRFLNERGKILKSEGWQELKAPTKSTH